MTIASLVSAASDCSFAEGNTHQAMACCQRGGCEMGDAHQSCCGDRVQKGSLVFETSTSPAPLNPQLTVALSVNTGLKITRDPVSASLLPAIDPSPPPLPTSLRI